MRAAESQALGKVIPFSSPQPCMAGINTSLWQVQEWRLRALLDVPWPVSGRTGLSGSSGSPRSKLSRCGALWTEWVLFLGVQPSQSVGDDHRVGALAGN